MDAGRIKFDRDRNVIFIKCTTGGGWIACHKLKVQGKAMLDAFNFNNGYQLSPLEKFV